MGTPDLSNESFSSLRLSFNADLFIEFDPRLFSMRFPQGGANSTLNLDSLLEKPVFVDSSRSTSVSPSNHHHQLMPRSMVLNSRVPTVKDAFRRYILLVLMKLSAKVKRLRLIWRSTVSSSGKEAVRDHEHGRGKRRVFDVDIECSIEDAVLHCKSSCGDFSREEV